MIAIRAGQRIKASDLQAIIADTAYLPGDVSFTSTTTLAPIGLALPVAAGQAYAVEGYVPYQAAEAGDLRITLAGPSGATGSWGLTGVSPASTGAVGDLNALRVVGFTTATTLFVGGGGTFNTLALLRGFLQVGSTAGQLAVHCAQATSSTTASIVRTGAWLRLTRIG